MKWYLLVWRQYAVFRGRARRIEFWTFFLFNVVISLALITVDSGLGDFGIFTDFYCLAALLPILAVEVRRLHDTGRSGWWLWLNLLPIVGGIVVLVMLLQDSEPGVNRFGPNPKGVARELRDVTPSPL